MLDFARRLEGGARVEIRPHSPLNYRPISLTRVPRKIHEHVIFSNLVSFLESNSFFTSFRHAFRKNYSCATHLISFIHGISSSLDKCQVIDCIFFDFAEARDKVSHRLLLLKLSTLNIEPNIFDWIE